MAQLLTLVLPEAWQTAERRPFPTDPDLAAVLGTLRAADWTDHNFTAACATLGKPERVANPTAVLTAHLRRCTGKPPPAMLPRATPSEPTGDGTPGHPFDEVNSRELAAFCRTIGANPDALRAATATMLADGLGVYLTLGPGDWQSLDVREAADIAGGWDVQWGFEPGEAPTLQGSLTEYPDDILATLCSRLHENPEGGMAAELRGAHLDFLAITPRLVNVNQFIKLVEVTRRTGRTAARWAGERLDQTGDPT